MIRNVIFDLDGTLLDTSEGIIESVRYAAGVLGYKELPQEELLDFVGPPVQISFKTHYGCDDAASQRAADVFRDYYKDHALLKAEPYDGIFELCELLKANNIRMAVATYKREDYALTLLRHFGFDRYCEPMHGADNNNKLTKQDIIRMCQMEMSADTHNSVLIGDTCNDAIGAEKSNTPFIAVTYGFGLKSQEEINKYPHIGIAKSPMEIISIIFEGVGRN